MTGRDRIVIIAVATLAILAAVWLLAVSPEREQASKLDAQVSSASAQLASAEGQVASARGDQARYAAAYASVVSLGKAVPASQEVPALIYQLDQASNQKDVEFASITAGGSGSSSASATAASTAASAGFTAMPFTFVFNGTYQDLYHLFQQLNNYTVQTSSGVQVSGRLLTIQGVKLSPAASTATATATASGSGKSREELSGTITATAYVLPAGQDLTGGATATSPTGATAPVSSTSGASSSPTAPAIARVNP
jgi:Tfp pilus assembly protein PilO